MTYIMFIKVKMPTNVGILILMSMINTISTTFSCSTQLSMIFIMFINIKMPTNVGILILMSMINTTSEHLKARNAFIF